MIAAANGKKVRYGGGVNGGGAVEDKGCGRMGGTILFDKCFAGKV